MLRQLRSGFTKSLKDLKLFMSDRTTRLGLFSYCIYAFAVQVLDEVYPLWCATSQYYGGLDFVLHEIGLSLSVVSILNLPFSFFLFPLFERLMGSINTFQFCALLQIFLAILLPSLHYFENTTLLWLFLVTMLLFMRLSDTVAMGFGTLFLFINNSVTFDKLGAVNGLGATLNALFRTVAPLFAGSIYSVSLTDGTSQLSSQLPSHLYHLCYHHSDSDGNGGLSTQDHQQTESSGKLTPRKQWCWQWW